MGFAPELARRVAARDFWHSYECIPAFHNTATSPTDCAYWHKLLRDDRPAERYRSVMRGWLDWLDTRLSADGAQQGPAQRAWSFGLLTFTMVLAFFYPILAITVQWFAGHAIDFGGQQVICGQPATSADIFPSLARIFVNFIPFCNSIKIPVALAMVYRRQWDFDLGTTLRG